MDQEKALREWESRFKLTDQDGFVEMAFTHAR